MVGQTPGVTGANVVSQKTGTILPSSGTMASEISSIETVDRTDTRIIGIIKLPYCPVPVTITNDTITYPDYITENIVAWNNGSSYWYLQVGTNFLNGFENELAISKDNFFNTFYLSKNFITDAKRDDLAESALYRSEYYQNRFVYDSFVYSILNEKIKPSRFTGTTPLYIKMVTTTTMNSRFLFDFNNKDKAFVYDNAEQDYPYIMNVARNNNIITYNSEYVNYMRNGYNYDVKAKNATILSANWGLGANILVTVSAIAPAAKTIPGIISNLSNIRKLTGLVTNSRTFDVRDLQEPLSNIAGIAQQTANNATAQPIALGNIFGSVSGIINNINTIRQTENTFEQKQKQMAQASVSVAGSDDIDLLSYYSGNRMKLETWTCSDRMKKALADLYYYQGYSTNEQKVPDTTTRKNFNFIQCNAVLTNEKNLDDKYIENLKERYAIGVTVLHKYNNTWDWDQTSGNLETFL